MNAIVAEFIGTALLILLGNGVVAACCLKDTKSGSAGWMVITTAWAFAVFVGVVVAGPSSGAHLNPAVSVGLFLAGLFSFKLLIPYIIAQLLGAMLGAFLVWWFYQDHFARTEDEGLKRACFCTTPAIYNLKVNFGNELIASFVLVFVIFYLVSEGNVVLADGADATPIGLGSIGALPVAILVWVIGLSLGATTGYAINPARDLGPRIVLSFLKNLKTDPDWSYAWVPVCAPIIGAALAAALFLML